MPVRLLNSSVLKWPERDSVGDALRRWAERIVSEHEEVLRIGCFGSFVRADWGVGSDLDIVMIVARSDESFERRAARWDTTSLPVAADLLVYTPIEWQRLTERQKHGSSPMGEVNWLYDRLKAKG